MSKPRKTGRPGIHQLPDQRWLIRVTTPHPMTGKQVARRKVLPATLTLNQASVARDELLAELVDEVAGSQLRTSSQNSLGDYATQWLEAKAASVRPRVAEGYRHALTRRILPVLGAMPCADITRADVQAWVVWAEQRRTARGTTYARDTVQGWWRVASALLRDMAADFELPDPTRRVKPPTTGRRKVREHRTLTQPQLTRLLQVVNAHLPEWHAEVFTLALTGMRPGELYGLQWKDIDLKGGVIHVRKSVSSSPEGPKVLLPKTGDPREVAITAPVVEVLRAHRRSQGRLDPKAIVFPSTFGGHRLPSVLLKILGLAGKLAGLPVRVGPQVLRRSYNTLLVERGVDPIVLRSQMGHTTAQMTERYSGVSVASKRAAVEALHLNTEVL